MTALSQPLPATLTAHEAGRQAWDIAVVGAGPAGSLAARELARRGRSVLLVDKASFPRHKVCGGCLSAATLDQLARIGLGDLPWRLGGEPLGRVLLCAGGRRAALDLPGGVAVSRHAFDAALVQEAVAAGAHLVQAHARLHSPDVPASQNVFRQLDLGQGSSSVAIDCRVVLAADGLGGRLADDLPQSKPRIEPDARIGAGVVLESSPASYQPGTVYMACGRGGYVGLACVEGGGLDLAAAFDLPYVQQVGGPGGAAANVIEEAGLPPIEGLSQAAWKATPSLTRHRPCLAAERLLVLGDAAGYVEPFTGEGILWAALCAVAAAPLADRAADAWHESLVPEWQAAHRQIVVRRQRLCRVLAGVLRRPKLARFLVVALGAAPWLASPLVRRAQSPHC